MDAFLTIVKIFCILASVQILFLLAKRIFKSKTPNMPITNSNTEEYYENKVSSTPIPSEELKNTLGIQIEAGKPLVEQLNAAWNRDYASAVRNRLITKRILSEREYDWYELELKRFFFLTVFIKQVPMYSEKVDAIWHDMILFTKDYGEFCDDFIGEMIHHIPNVGGGPKHYEEIEHERALFELLYTIIFSTHEKTEEIHGRFYNKKLSRSFIEKVKNSSETGIERLLDKEVFRHKHLSAEPIIREVQKDLKEKLAYLVYQLNKSTKKAETYTRTYNDFSQKKKRDYTSDDMTNLILFNSLIVTYDEPERIVHSSNSSNHDHSNHSTHSSNDSKSSCSSCSSSSCSSSSCSSSCGGGCSS